MNSEYKIQVDHVSKSFRMYNSPMDRMKEALSISGKSRHKDFYAITDLSFKVKSGEILGIMGRNGAGKSTVLKMITGIYEPTEGSISVSGKICSLLELGTGFNMEYTGIENIFFYGTLMGFTHTEMEEKLSEIIEFAEIGDYIYQPVKTYSSGMFARLAFSCAISVDPDILIVDEILSVGDMRFQAKCFNKFKEFKNKGVTILYVGHDVGLMRTFCDTAMWINKGKIVDIGDPTFISAKYTEFMYQDTITDFTDYKRIETDSDSESNKEKQEEEVVEEPHKVSQKIENTIFPDCLAHWGTSTGMVTSVKMLGKGGKGKNVFETDENIKIVIEFDVPSKIDVKNFSIAFSIKNKEGTDLIVKTTYDEEVELRKGRKQKISFDFIPRLAIGDYYLVVALEDRKNMAISYYEYIEGACFFKVYSSKKIFGVYDVLTKIEY